MSSMTLSAHSERSRSFLIESLLSPCNPSISNCSSSSGSGFSSSSSSSTTSKPTITTTASLNASLISSSCTTDHASSPVIVTNGNSSTSAAAHHHHHHHHHVLPKKKKQIPVGIAVARQRNNQASAISPCAKPDLLIDDVTPAINTLTTSRCSMTAAVSPPASAAAAACTTAGSLTEGKVNGKELAPAPAPAAGASSVANVMNPLKVEQNQSVLNFINARGLDLLVDLVEQQQQQSSSSSCSNFTQTITRDVDLSDTGSSTTAAVVVESNNLDLLSMLCEQRCRDEEMERQQQQSLRDKRRLSYPTCDPILKHDAHQPDQLIRINGSSLQPVSSISPCDDSDRESCVPLKKRIRRFSSLDPNQMTGTTTPVTTVSPVTVAPIIQETEPADAKRIVPSIRIQTSPNSSTSGSAGGGLLMKIKKELMLSHNSSSTITTPSPATKGIKVLLKRKPEPAGSLMPKMQSGISQNKSNFTSSSISKNKVIRKSDQRSNHPAKGSPATATTTAAAGTGVLAKNRILSPRKKADTTSDIRKRMDTEKKNNKNKKSIPSSSSSLSNNSSCNSSISPTIIISNKNRTSIIHPDPAVVKMEPIATSAPSVVDPYDFSSAIEFDDNFQREHRRDQGVSLSGSSSIPCRDRDDHESAGKKHKKKERREKRKHRTAGNEPENAASSPLTGSISQINNSSSISFTLNNKKTKSKKDHKEDRSSSSQSDSKGPKIQKSDKRMNNDVRMKEKEKKKKNENRISKNSISKASTNTSSSPSLAADSLTATAAAAVPSSSPISPVKSNTHTLTISSSNSTSKTTTMKSDHKDQSKSAKSSSSSSSSSPSKRSSLTGRISGAKSDTTTTTSSDHRHQQQQRERSTSQSQNNDWFAIRRSERIFFAHEFGSSFSLRDKRDSSSSSNSSHASESDDQEEREEEEEDKDAETIYYMTTATTTTTTTMTMTTTTTTTMTMTGTKNKSTSDKTKDPVRVEGKDDTTDKVQKDSEHQIQTKDPDHQDQCPVLRTSCKSSSSRTRGEKRKRTAGADAADAAAGDNKTSSSSSKHHKHRHKRHRHEDEAAAPESKSKKRKIKDKKVDDESTITPALVAHDEKGEKDDKSSTAVTLPQSPAKSTALSIRFPGTIRRSLDSEAGSESTTTTLESNGGIFCWEFQGSPIKKSYQTLKPVSRSGCQSRTTIRKDFFTAVKRTRVVSGISPIRRISSDSHEYDSDDDQKMILRIGECAIFCSSSTPTSATPPIQSSPTSGNNNEDQVPQSDQTSGKLTVNPLSECNRPPRLPFIGRIDSFWREASKTQTTAITSSTNSSSAASVATALNLISPGSTPSTTTLSSSSLSTSTATTTAAAPTQSAAPTPEKVSEKGEYNLRKGSSPSKKKPGVKVHEQPAAMSPSPPVIIEEEEKMMVKVRWFYHPSEAVSKHKKTDPVRVLCSPDGGLFESFTHSDENDVQTIASKCHVLPYEEFVLKNKNKLVKEHASDRRIYYLAGKYEPLVKEITFELGVPLNTPA